MMAERDSSSMSTGLCCLCIALAPLVFARPLEAKPVYTILPANTLVAGINDGGAVTGHYYDGRGLVRTPDGKITTFDVPGDAYGTFPGGINADDAITGYDDDANFMEHGFVRTAAGKITVFDPTGSHGTIAMGITKTGAIGGYYFDNAGFAHGFVRSANGTITSFDVAQATDTYGMGINDNGAIAGRYIDQSGHYHGFVRTAAGKITTFDATANSVLTWVYTINAKGVIPGYFEDADGSSHAYIRAANGTVTAFDAPGADTSPVGINASGETVGQYLIHNGKGKIGFIRKPGGAIISFRVPGMTGVDILESVNTAGVIGGTAFTQSGHTTTEFGFIRTP